jgi:tetratricopeptide (TPR) repeat protein
VRLSFATRALCAAVIALAAAGAFAQSDFPEASADGADTHAPGNSDVRRLVAAGEKFRFAEDWYSAIDDYLAATAQNPSYGEAYIGLAECYYELGEYDQALSYVRKAAPFRRGDTELANLEGFVRVGLGDLKGARAAFDSVSAALPNDLDAHFGLSLLDLSAGKKSAAREKLEESLRISPQNGRALLSLALIAQDQGRKYEAQELIEKALRYHGSEAKTQYVAANLAAARGDFEKAAFYARNALDIKPGYSEARLLLGSLMYSSRSYDQAIALMREAVSRDRKNGMAWYTLGMAQFGAGKNADAIYSLKTASGQRPDDEIARLALEYVVSASTNAEDASRAAYADYHVWRGKEFEDRSSYDQAIFEYRRALRVYPYSKTARLAYAQMLKSRGFPGKYLSELQFIQKNGAGDQAVDDAVETYSSLLQDSVGKDWQVDEEALPKRPYKLALMYVDAPNGATPGASVHAAGQELVLRYIQGILASSSRLSVLALPPKAVSFADAFKTAREAEADYFALVSIKETERDVEIGVDLRVARTGSPAVSFKSYRTGNDRLKNSAARATELIAESMPPLGSLLKRSQDSVLVDLGKSDSLKVGDKLVVVKKGSVEPKPEGLGVSYPQSAVLAEIDVTAVGEEASAGTMKRAQFFDTVNIGDQVVIAPAEPAKVSGKVPGKATASPAKGSTGMPASSGVAATATADVQKEWPGLYTAIRALR